jgi:hypothetical protein
MMIRIFALIVCFFSASTFACTNALPTNDVSFCASFRVAATCYCSEKIPSGMCQNMETLYNRMIAMYGSLQNACARQQHTTQQDCVDNWTCYRRGGIDSQGKSCSSNQKACQ